MKLFSELAPDTTLLTPNRRLSASFLKMHQQWQQAENKSCWATLDILPLSSWLQRVWSDSTAKDVRASAMLLTPKQEQLLWEKNLRESPENDYLLQLANTAELAKSAWGILKQWRVTLDNPALKTTEDGCIFHTWAEKFQQSCEKNNWLDTQSLADKICEKIQAGEIIPPKNIILIGFTEISPLYQYLLDSCEQQGSVIRKYQTDQVDNVAQRVSIQDEETEILTMARWAKNIYDKNKLATIGCIIPNLESQRDNVIQHFSAVFNTENTYNLDYTTLPFNISAGKSLAQYPIIHTAFLLLKLQIDNISLDTLSHLLHTPFLGESEKEMLARAQLHDAFLRTNSTNFSLKQLLDSQLRSTTPALAIRLTQLKESIESRKNLLSISEWVNYFMELLTLLGWPGERSLSSHEYQVVQAWLSLLKEYAHSEAVLGPQTYARALDYLLRLAIKTIFQPQSPEATIQILGILEATEIPFDYLWVMGLDDTAWPPSPKPNPFIPQRLQKTLNMPHANAERELIYCQQLTTQLKHSAKNIFFSYAAQNNEAELRPSPLLLSIPEISSDKITLSPYTTLADTIYQTKHIETLHDEIAPSITDTTLIRGGVNIFRLQAACPFKAFAELRLHARRVDTPMLGLRPQDRGVLVHKALEIIWLELRDQDNLLSKSQIELKQIIRHSIEQAIAITVPIQSNNTRYLALEVQRLESIIWDWLTIEKSRPYFKVLAQEQERNVTINMIPVKLRIDRIDELADGTQVIIDYKTGKNNSLKAWFGERLDEPQLPLYCVTENKNITGIMFAQINIEEIELKGISHTPLDISSVKMITDINYADASTWTEQLKHWQTNLEKLGSEFYSGNAHVDPKDSIETCRYCTLQSLCRVAEYD
ncbi:MAG: PD-(D/E)XK nuclease family protein [Gammaproteobacteria bacterium]|nr:PD-(D/E)XK nuclease family protein [Gammaproteobacteria bacterium]